MDDTKDIINSAPSNLDKVYAEASQWVRMCNLLIWQMAAIFVPISGGCIGYAITHPNLKMYLCVASISAFSIWAYISKLYSRTAVEARVVLASIETAWGVPSELAIYRTHGQPAFHRLNILRLQHLSIVALVVFWLAFLI